MKITKPKENQLLIEGEEIKDFKLNREFKETDLIDNEELNENYEVFILNYRFKGDNCSKSMFVAKNKASLMTSICAMLDGLMSKGTIDMKDLKFALKLIEKSRRNRK